MTRTGLWRPACVCLGIVLGGWGRAPLPAWAQSAVDGAIADAQAKVVKIYGAGGFQGLESYQTGILFSPHGDIVTVWSTVLDTDVVSAVLYDGRRFAAKVLGADPRLDIAVLKIDATELAAYDLGRAKAGQTGDRILALGNAFGVATGNEAVSVQRGTISTVTRLAASQGVFETPYRGSVYVLDVVTNNRGAQGGAVVNLQGQLIGLLGKELKNSLNHTWLNYAIPIAELAETAESIRAGRVPAGKASEPRKPEKPVDLTHLGLVLTPDVVARTPPYVDRVRAGSSAATAGLCPDDLVVLVGGRVVSSCKSLRSELATIDRDDPVNLTVLRGQELIEVTLRGSSP